jgi:hypothetical protein
MPNWCSNVISINGPQPVIANLWEKVQAEGSGLLNALVPMPNNTFMGNLGEEERKMCEEQGIPNWYDWSVTNWGTKWDVDPEGLEFADHGDGTAEILGHFESAWSPPIEAVAAYQERMLTELGIDTDIDLMYYEPGMAFAGQWLNGDHSECDISDATADTVAEIVGEDIDRAFDISGYMAEWEDEDDV